MTIHFTTGLARASVSVTHSVGDL